MNRKAATAALAALPVITARVRDGEWRVTIKLSAICERFPNMTRTECQTHGEEMAAYTDDNADAVGTAQRMAKHWAETDPLLPPAHVVAIWDGDMLTNGGGLPVWGGNGAPPRIGSQVEVAGRVRGIMATVTGYEVKAGWLMALAYRTATPAVRGDLAGTEIRYPD